MPQQSAIEHFLSCDRIAFVGASRQPKSFAAKLYRQLKANGHELVPVNALAAGVPIDGDQSYASLADIPGVVDAAYVIVPRHDMVRVVADAAACRIRHVWLHRGAGEKPVPDAALQIAADAGIEVVDGACALMFDGSVRGVHKLHRLLIRHRFAA
jgi:uncharacterized protein